MVYHQAMETLLVLLDEKMVNILKLIGSAFLPKKQAKTEQFITKLPDFQTLEEVVEFVEQKYQQQNAQLMAENLRFKQKAEAQAKGRKEQSQQMELMQAVHERKTELQKMKKSKILKFKIEGLHRPPTFFLKNNRAIGQFMGFVLQETDDGNHLFYPWLRLSNKQDVKFEKFTHRFEDFFKDELGVVSQMRGGKIDTNFDIGEDGKAILRGNKVLYDKPDGATITVQDLKKVHDLQKMAESERREFEQKIAKLKGQLNEYANIIMDERKEKEEMDKKITDQQIEVEVSQKDQEIWKATVAAEAKNKEVVTKTVADSLLAIQDTKTSQILTERMNQSLLDAMNRLRRKYQEGLYKEDREIEETRQKDMMRSVAKEVVQESKPVAAAPAMPPPKG